MAAVAKGVRRAVRRLADFADEFFSTSYAHEPSRETKHAAE